MTTAPYFTQPVGNCIDWNSLVLFKTGACLTQKSSEETETWKKVNIPDTFGEQKCSPMEINGQKMFTKTFCDKDVAVIDMYFDENCEKQIEGAPSYKVDFKQGDSGCFTTDGKSFFNIAQNGWSYPDQGPKDPFPTGPADKDSDSYNSKGDSYDIYGSNGKDEVYASYGPASYDVYGSYEGKDFNGTYDTSGDIYGSYGETYASYDKEGAYGSYGDVYASYGAAGDIYASKGDNYASYGSNGDIYGTYGGNYGSYDKDGSYGSYGDVYGSYGAGGDIYGSYGDTYGSYAAGGDAYGSYGDIYGSYGAGGDIYGSYGNSYASYGQNGINAYASASGMDVYGSYGDRGVNANLNADFAKGEVNYPQAEDGNTLKVDGDGYGVQVSMSQDQVKGQQLTSEMKFDKYFLYGIDNMGGQGNGAPETCSGGQDDPCKNLVGSGKSCCAHVVMTDRGSGTQQSMYRCMNERIVDMSFSIEIDGMSLAMGCSDKSNAKYIASAAVASFATIASLTLF